MINVSGHRIGTAEVEGALEEHPACAEAAVVGCVSFLTSSSKCWSRSVSLAVMLMTPTPRPTQQRALLILDMIKARDLCFFIK